MRLMLPADALMGRVSVRVFMTSEPVKCTRKLINRRHADNRNV
jgi:hypothetical protein